jgi:hypothetical protein
MMTPKMPTRWIILFCLGISLTVWAEGHRSQKTELPLALIVPPADLPHLVMGYNEVASDSLWIRVIQDFDRCEQPELDPDLKVQKLKESQELLASPGVPIRSRCGKGWVYHMLDSITELTPEFRLPYSLGGAALSVLVDDRAGATAILEKGVNRFPNDWVIQYRAAYHQLFEEKNQLRASELLVRAGKNGGPPWLFFLAARLATSQGKAMLAKSIIEEQIEAATTEEKKVELQKRLDFINETLKKNPPSN